MAVSVKVVNSTFPSPAGARWSAVIYSSRNFRYI
jgi:hypothetical protein